MDSRKRREKRGDKPLHPHLAIEEYVGLYREKNVNEGRYRSEETKTSVKFIGRGRDI